MFTIVIFWNLKSTHTPSHFVNVEAPEEAPQDCRSLYEKLEEQKQKKQEEHDEQYKLSK